MAYLDDRSGRDGRLLGLIIIIAIVVLVVLARFRFPATDSHSAPVTPGPLERLAARATFEDLAAAVQTTLQRVEPALMMIAIEPNAPGQKPGISDRSMIAAVRVSDDWAVAQLPSGFHVVKATPEDPLVIRESDTVKDIAIVSRPLGPGEDHLPAGTADLSGFTYVCVVEASLVGPTASPMFVGKIRTLLDDRWASTVMAPAGSAALPAGAAIFQIDGRFIGIAMPGQTGGTAVVPAALLESAVTAARQRSPGGLP